MMGQRSAQVTLVRWYCVSTIWGADSSDDWRYGVMLQERVNSQQSTFSHTRKSRMFPWMKRV